MRRWLVYSALGLLAIIALCGLALLALWWSYQPPNVWQNPPIYPGAQAVTVQDFGPNGKYQEDDPWGGFSFARKLIRFTVLDSEENVGTYYRKALKSGGMHPRDWLASEIPPNRLDYSWTGHSRPPAVYYSSVTTTSSAPGKTDVEIQVYYFPGY